ncbi:MAG: hypothetical protein WCD18_27700, partial [Thermosynechococcaceae cyanobacterium]
RLRGSSASIGAWPLEQLLAHLEQVAKEQDPSAMELSIFTALENTFAAVVTDIDHYCQVILVTQSPYQD